MFEYDPRLRESAGNLDKLERFIKLTRASTELSISCLKYHNWNFDRAIHYFSLRQMRSIDNNKIIMLFRRYQDFHHVGKMLANGCERFLNDLNLPANSIMVLIIAWQFNAKKQCEFTKDEFINGLKRMGADSLDKILNVLPVIYEQLDDPNKFKEFYTFTFAYGKDCCKKIMDINTAIEYWRIVFEGRFKFLDDWLIFLLETKVKFITEDTWNLLLEFTTLYTDNLTDYDFEGAWPHLIDQFVNWYTAKQTATKNTQSPDISNMDMD